MYQRLLIRSPPLLPGRVPPLTPCEPLLLSCLSRPLLCPCLAFPIFWPWHHVHDGGGNDNELCRYVVLLCVCSCVCACAHVHVRTCRWFVRSWVLSFSVYVCLLVCVGGGGRACLDRCMGEGVFVRECFECVTAFFDFWLPRFVCMWIRECVYAHVCVCVCVCPCACAHV